jgi:hypothetical protein
MSIMIGSVYQLMDLYQMVGPHTSLWQSVIMRRRTKVLRINNWEEINTMMRGHDVRGRLCKIPPNNIRGKPLKL